MVKKKCHPPKSDGSAKQGMWQPCPTGLKSLTWMREATPEGGCWFQAASLCCLSPSSFVRPRSLAHTFMSLRWQLTPVDSVNCYFTSIIYSPLPAVLFHSYCGWTFPWDSTICLNHMLGVQLSPSPCCSVKMKMWPAQCLQPSLFSSTALQECMSASSDHCDPHKQAWGIAPTIIIKHKWGCM